ncbi:MAG: hypothetical protein DI537_42530, partial [Stutzerimonas stutzeri]
MTDVAQEPSVTPRETYAFLVWRKSGGRAPRFRHQTLEAATTEAKRLANERPGGTYLVLQEIVRVTVDRAPKSNPAAAPDAAGGAGRQCPLSPGSK